MVVVHAAVYPGRRWELSVQVGVRAICLSRLGVGWKMVVDLCISMSKLRARACLSAHPCGGWGWSPSIHQGRGGGWLRAGYP